MKRLVKILGMMVIMFGMISKSQYVDVNAKCVPAIIELNNYFGTYRSIYIKSHGFKCYTRYTAITRKSSLQYKLQKEFAYTGEYGIRQVNGRFCVAVGTGVTKKMGQYIDVVLENGTIIQCIVCDQKADQHTMADRITTAHNKCVCEFYLDTVLPEIRECGDVSKACPEWQSPVCEFRVYDVNVFELSEDVIKRNFMDYRYEVSLL